MIGGIVVMLIMTFGLSRLLYVLPKTLDERAKALWANLGTLLVIAALYAAIADVERDGLTFSHWWLWGWPWPCHAKRFGIGGTSRSSLRLPLTLQFQRYLHLR
jgi:hypothetical protein